MVSCSVDIRLVAKGFDGPLPSKLEDLTLDSAQITFRKVRLNGAYKFLCPS